MNIDKYLITESPISPEMKRIVSGKAKSFWMKEYLKIRTIQIRSNGQIWAILKKNKSDKDVFKNEKELMDYVENNWRPPKGGTQSSQF